MNDAYDAVPYTEHAYAESHPDNLEVVARVAGWSIAPAAAGPRRVLELGCGRGGNLLPMASSWPEAIFLGVDRSAAQIGHARQVAEAAGLTNVTFDVGDASAVDVGGGVFDFVVCHGVYSWVSMEARRAILGRVRAALAPSGVAYVSYNTLPGWYRKLAARDWMRFASQWPDLQLEPKQALAWLVAAASPGLEAYRRDVDEVRRRLLETDAAYAMHEFLSEEHHPVDVATFLAEARAAGLTYLGDGLPGGDRAGAPLRPRPPSR
jgi:SAM-dependent methyltransferase